MADEIEAIFERNLRLVEDEKRRVFVEKMREYREKYRFYQAEDMNYQENDNYLNESFCVSVVDQDDYWVYSPQFNKTMGLVIGKLFKTKITHVALACHAWNNGTVFYDVHKNRWLMAFLRRDDDPKKIYVTMRMPRSKSNLDVCDVLDDKDVMNPRFEGHVWVMSVSKWYDD